MIKHYLMNLYAFAGFVFMLLVDHVSSTMNDSAVPAERNVTATIGLVVHAAGTPIIFFLYRTRIPNARSQWIYYIPNLKNS